MAAKTKFAQPPPNTQMIYWVKVVYMDGQVLEMGFEYFALSEERRVYHAHHHYDRDACKLRPTTMYIPFENVRTATMQEIRVAILDD